MNAVKSVLVAGLIVTVLAACEPSEDQTQIGIVVQPSDGLRIGDHAPDFEFVDVSGKRLRFRDIRGDVTIVAIIDSLTDPNVCSVANNVLRLAEKYSGIETDVKYVCVSQPPGGTCDIESNVATQCGLRSKRIIALCDAGARARRAFRAKKGKIYFLIGADGRIAAKGKTDDLRGMEAALRDAVSKHETNLPGPFDE